MPDIAKIKAKVAKIKKMISELFDRSVILEPVIKMVVCIVHINNIWSILYPISVPTMET